MLKYEDEVASHSNCFVFVVSVIVFTYILHGKCLLQRASTKFCLIFFRTTPPRNLSDKATLTVDGKVCTVLKRQ